MPAYAFEALTPSGQTEKGLLEADTARAARGLLRSRGLVPLAVEPAAAQATDGGTGLNRTLWASRVYGPAALAVWTRQMAGLVASGLPLERALGALTDEADDHRQRHLLATLRAEVNAGSTFARALQQHRREFSDVYTAVVAAGEQSGALGAVLDTPLPTLQIAVSRLLGGPHAATVIANLCYLAAALLAVIGLYTRLLPDHWAAAVLNRRVVQPLIAAAAVMVAAFNVSAAARSGSPLTHLYFIPRDGWLTLYWVVYCLALQTLLVVFIYGLGKLDNRHIWTRLYRVAVLSAVVASMMQLIGLVSHPPVLIMLCWSLGYGCTILMSVAAGMSWRQRARQVSA